MAITVHESKSTPFFRLHVIPRKNQHILVNSAKCKQCESVLTSDIENIFMTCKCGEIAIKGGNDYILHQYIRKRNYINRVIIKIDDETN